ncbi:hypothetical protein W822_22060 [Advenella kashmirensis W13003]|uniref:Uncharacterized protein n=1 Tax=Advenella kashmirensis W13003 TaxID=1424334 RepID=V8QKT9_9BURK|nr:hypothetical protein W822_22060 [Advenella kashmirensis W13003]
MYWPPLLITFGRQQRQHKPETAMNTLFLQANDLRGCGGLNVQGRLPKNGCICKLLHLRFFLRARLSTTMGWKGPIFLLYD